MISDTREELRYFPELSGVAYVQYPVVIVQEVETYGQRLSGGGQTTHLVGLRTIIYLQVTIIVTINEALALPFPLRLSLPHDNPLCHFEVKPRLRFKFFLWLRSPE
jgi:hypothetical protein